MEMYRILPSDTKDIRYVEQILGFGITFYACLLENPGIWDVEVFAEGGQIDENELIAV